MSRAPIMPATVLHPEQIAVRLRLRRRPAGRRQGGRALVRRASLGSSPLSRNSEPLQASWPGPVPASKGTYVQEEMARQEARCITSAPLFHTP